MLKVFDAQHHAEAHFVQGLLVAEGVDAEVRGESLFTTMEGASAIPGMRPEVWILDEALRLPALALVERYRSGAGFQGPGEAPWTCACGEVHEPQFTSCWRCQALAP